jgi:hypothetical protein
LLIALLASTFCTVALAQDPSVQRFKADVQPLLQKYCYECHADGQNNGKVEFDKLTSDSAILDHDLWLRALKNVRANIMPPAYADQPTEAEVKTLETWIKRDAFKIDPANPDPGRVTLRRLNRVEYRNTIRDLMGIDYNTEEEFPPDDTGYGFDNIGDVLSVSPMLLEKYMAAAEKITQQAVPTVSKVVAEKTISGAALISGGRGGGRGGNSDRVSVATGGTYSRPITIDQPGEYRIIVQTSVNGSFDYDPGKATMHFKADGEQLFEDHYVWQNSKDYSYDAVRKFEPGEHELTFEIVPIVDQLAAAATQPSALDPSDLQAIAAQQGDAQQAQGPAQAAPQQQGAPLQPQAPAQGRGRGQAPPRRTNIDVRFVRVIIEGPLDESKWIAPPNYNRFFTRANPPTESAERKAYAREVLGRFATRAFRRPVDEKTLAKLVAIAESIYTEPGKKFENGIQQAMTAVLASPRFIFRTEDVVAEQKDQQFAQVDEYALASRLSYFLWSTMPDEELFNLAARGELRKNLDAQVKRMLADNRSQAFIENFTGQWLEVRDIDTAAIDAAVVLARDAGTEAELKAQQEAARAARGNRGNRGNRANLAAQDPQAQPNPNAQQASPQQGAPQQPAPQQADAARGQAAPGALARGQGRGNRGNRGNGNAPAAPAVTLDAPLRRAMKMETLFYIDYIVHQDRSVLEMLSSNYTFLNARLAQHYGIEGVSGIEMQKVDLPEGSPRGGLLTQGSFLVVTSNSTRTSPVKRGLFILDNFLGNPPPPPPADVPQIEVAEQTLGKEPTMREALALHREKPLCSACHQRMDSLGLAFENFNALGMYRTKERNQDIDASGKLLTGEQLKNANDLKKILINERHMDFYRCLTEKLMTYALGRGLEYYDTEAVDKIVEQLEKNDGRFSTVLMGVIESAPFQERRNMQPAPPAPAAPVQRASLDEVR